ncbi:hypothetical protein [Streptomyces erythrochromogenes]|uniref:hypothetical protein n=1 Tax=Streptomyces erythrochromogenes TaxID=285574 RepID=UPI003689F077
MATEHPGYDAERVLTQAGTAVARHTDRTAVGHGVAVRALALDVCGAVVRCGTASHGLPFLADLGPLAAVHTTPVRCPTESPGAWTRTYAAHAYRRITGEPEPAVPVLPAEVDRPGTAIRPCRYGRPYGSSGRSAPRPFRRRPRCTGS